MAIERAGFGENGEFRWHIEPDESAVIIAWKGNVRHLHIPETLEGRRVTGIGEGAFAGTKGLYLVKLPAGAVFVGKSAFEGCIHLNWVTLPDGLVSIGEEAFAGCIQLFHVRIPESIAFIGDHAFAGCRRLRRVRLPEGMSEVGEGTFYHGTKFG